MRHRLTRRARPCVGRRPVPCPTGALRVTRGTWTGGHLLHRGWRRAAPELWATALDAGAFRHRGGRAPCSACLPAPRAEATHPPSAAGARRRCTRAPGWPGTLEGMFASAESRGDSPSVCCRRGSGGAWRTGSRCRPGKSRACAWGRPSWCRRAPRSAPRKYGTRSCKHWAARSACAGLLLSTLPPHGLGPCMPGCAALRTHSKAGPRDIPRVRRPACRRLRAVCAAPPAPAVQAHTQCLARPHGERLHGAPRTAPPASGWGARGVQATNGLDPTRCLHVLA